MTARVDAGPVGDDFGGIGERDSASSRSAWRREVWSVVEEDIDDLAEVVDGPVLVPRAEPVTSRWVSLANQRSPRP